MRRHVRLMFQLLRRSRSLLLSLYRAKNITLKKRSRSPSPLRYREMKLNRSISIHALTRPTPLILRYSRVHCKHDHPRVLRRRLPHFKLRRVLQTERPELPQPKFNLDLHHRNSEQPLHILTQVPRKRERQRVVASLAAPRHLLLFPPTQIPFKPKHLRLPS
jgi:hypothetical protein